jgi:hypothetical protein
MKIFLIVLTVFFINVSGFSQSIVDIFLELPDVAAHNLTKNERKEIVKYSLNNKSEKDAYDVMRKNNISYSFEIVDIKNCFISLIGAFEGKYRMCFWYMKDGTKLVAIYEEAYATIAYVQSFDFYKYDGKTFTALDIKKIIPDVYNDFFNGNSEAQTKEMKQKDITATLLFVLPQNGLNITAKWGNSDSTEVYKKYAKGNRMTLIWDNGVFKKGKIYWEE